MINDSHPRLLEHGGRLKQAAEAFSIPVEQWIDLSTGINPEGYPITPPPAECWQRLPEEEDGLLKIASRYYGCNHLLAVPGSQAAIQILPRLRHRSRVAILAPTYNEHAHAWRSNGHLVELIENRDISDSIEHYDVLVVVNPNNPTGRLVDQDQLLEWQKVLAAKDGWLVVDEAFMDSTPEHSLLQTDPTQGLIILRSVGKYFGLAGIRCGFVIAEPELLTTIALKLGPWPVSGPSRFICMQALKDQAWQESTRLRLISQSQRLQYLIEKQTGLFSKGCSLFQTIAISDAQGWFELLAKQGILTRAFPESGLLRIGLPSNEQQWRRLEQGLETLQSKFR